MAKPTISVLMPVYNGEKYLHEAISSVLGQTFADFELIICDDNSDDSTEKIVKAFSDPRIKYSKNQTRLGLAENRNTTLIKALGSYIAILDADDVALPSRLQTQLNFLETHNEYVLCASQAEVISSTGAVLAHWYFPLDSRALQARFYVQFPFVHSSLMMRSSCIQKRKITYDPKFSPAEDYHFVSQLLSMGKMSVINTTLVKYRLHDQNMSKKSNDVVSKKLPKLYKKLYFKIGLSISDPDIQDMVYLYNPQANVPVDIIRTLKNCFLLFKRLQVTYELSFWSSLDWWYYTLKAVIHQALFIFDKPKTSSTI